MLPLYTKCKGSQYPNYTLSLQIPGSNAPHVLHTLQSAESEDYKTCIYRSSCTQTISMCRRFCVQNGIVCNGNLKVLSLSYLRVMFWTLRQRLTLINRM